MIASVADEVWSAVSTEPLSFVLGGLVGFIASNRWRITRRDEKRRGSE